MVIEIPYFYYKIDNNKMRKCKYCGYSDIYRVLEMCRMEKKVTGETRCQG